MKKLMVLWAVVAVMAAMSVPGFAGETPETRVAAEKLLNLFNMEETFEQTMKQAAEMSLNMVDSQNLSDSERQQAKAAAEASMKVTMEKFSWEKMKGMFVDIYADVLSMEELQGLIAFYETPIGQSFIKKQPQLSVATMQKMQTLMKDLMPAIQGEVTKSLQSAKPASTADTKGTETKE